jgi:hypothetical protein
MKKILKKLSAILLLGSLLMIAIPASISHAAPFDFGDMLKLDSTAPYIPHPDLLPGGALENETNQTVIQEYFSDSAIPTFIAYFMGLIGGVALIALIWAGIRFITAFGEEEGITEAKRTATWAVVGFGITILSYAIVSVVNTLAFPEDNNAYTTNDVETIIYDDI